MSAERTIPHPGLTADEFKRTLPRVADLSEQAALRQLEERLTSTYTDVPAEQVVTAIHAAYREFDAARIRDFVPLFVERRTRDRLSLK